MGPILRYLPILSASIHIERPITRLLSHPSANLSSTRRTAKVPTYYLWVYIAACWP